MEAENTVRPAQRRRRQTAPSLRPPRARCSDRAPPRVGAESHKILSARPPSFRHLPTKIPPPVRVRPMVSTPGALELPNFVPLTAVAAAEGEAASLRTADASFVSAPPTVSATEARIGGEDAVFVVAVRSLRPHRHSPASPTAILRRHQFVAVEFRHQILAGGGARAAARRLLPLRRISLRCVSSCSGTTRCHERADSWPSARKNRESAIGGGRSDRCAARYFDHDSVSVQRGPPSSVSVGFLTEKDGRCFVLSVVAAQSVRFSLLLLSPLLLVNVEQGGRILRSAKWDRSSEVSVISSINRGFILLLTLLLFLFLELLPPPPRNKTSLTM